MPESAELAGEVSALRTGARLRIPAEIRRITRWLQGKKPIKVIAELLEPGHVRLHEAENVLPKIEELRVRIVEGHTNPREELLALFDRFRPVTYYPSDTRIHLTPSIASYLCPSVSEDQLLYVETHGNRVDILTLELRNRRLENLRSVLRLPDGKE